MLLPNRLDFERWFVRSVVRENLLEISSFTLYVFFIWSNASCVEKCLLERHENSSLIAVPTDGPRHPTPAQGRRQDDSYEINSAN